MEILMNGTQLYNEYPDELLLAIYTAKTGLELPQYDKPELTNLLGKSNRNDPFTVIDDQTAWRYALVFAQHATYKIYTISNEYSVNLDTPEQIIQVFQGYFHPAHLRATIDVFVNFFFYIDTSRLYTKRYHMMPGFLATAAMVLPIDALFGANISSYLSGLSPEDLLELLGAKYLGARDHASLLFAAVTGFSTRVSNLPNVNTILASPRYQLVKQYPPQKISLILNTLYVPETIDLDLPVYIRLSAKQGSLIDKILIYATNDNLPTLLDKYGIVIPSGIDPNFLLYLFIYNIKYYDPILNRPANFPPPSLLYNIQSEDISKVIRMYTCKELIETFELNIEQPYQMPDLWKKVIDVIGQTR